MTISRILEDTDNGTFDLETKSPMQKRVACRAKNATRKVITLFAYLGDFITYRTLSQAVS